MGSVVLLDTLSLLFRAHHAMPPLSTSRGEPTGALYGFAALLVKLLRERDPEGLAFAMDRGPTFRHRAWPGYKARRATPPDDLLRQIGRLRALVAALEVPAHACADHEADDVLATLARRLGDALVVSGDTDLLQVARERVRVLFVGRRGKDHVLYDASAVRARYGVAPPRVASWKALVGDASDGIPGVPGIGGRRATELLERYGDVSGVLAHADELPSRVRAGLEACRAVLPLWEDLMRLRDDLPLREPLVAPVDDALLERLRRELDALEFRTLLTRLHPVAPRGTSR